MAASETFDVTTGCELQEVDNAVNQTLKVLTNRYDFRGVKIGIDFNRDENKINLTAPDEFKLQAMKGTLWTRMSQRGVPVKNLDQGKVEIGTLGRARQAIGLKQGIDQETAKKMVKAVKDHGFKKVQVQIQGDELRVTSPSKDDLQGAMALLKGEDWGVELQFGNYR